MKMTNLNGHNLTLDDFEYETGFLEPGTVVEAYGHKYIVTEASISTRDADPVPSVLYSLERITTDTSGRKDPNVFDNISVRAPYYPKDNIEEPSESVKQEFLKLLE